MCVCACLSILSYLATGVVSAISATAYLQVGGWVEEENAVRTSCHPLIHPPTYNKQKQEIYPSLSLTGGAVGLLFLFACLVCMGMSESGRVAATLYILHMAVLTILLCLGVAYSSVHTDLFWENMNAPFPDVTIVDRVQRGTLGTALLYGFSSGMLGVTGFETSANFVEEQKPGVFVKTLRNMWWGVSIYNPLLVLLSLFCFPVQEISEKHQVTHPPTLAIQHLNQASTHPPTHPPSPTGLDHRSYGEGDRRLVGLSFLLHLLGKNPQRYRRMGRLLSASSTSHPPTHPPTHPPISPSSSISWGRILSDIVAWDAFLVLAVRLTHPPTHPPTHPSLLPPPSRGGGSSATSSRGTPS